MNNAGTLYFRLKLSRLKNFLGWQPPIDTPSATSIHIRIQLMKRMADNNTLTENERTVLMLRFGLDGDGRNHSLRKTAGLMNLSHGRVRQIEAFALIKLRVGYES